MSNQTIKMKTGSLPLIYSILIFSSVSVFSDYGSSNLLEQKYQKNYNGDESGSSAVVSEHEHLMSDEKLVTLGFITQETDALAETGPFYSLILRYRKPSKTGKMYVSNGLTYEDSIFGTTVSVNYRFDKEEVVSVKGTVDNSLRELTLIEIDLTDKQLESILREIKTADRFIFTIDDKGGTILTTLPKFDNKFDLATHAVENFQYRIGKIEDDPVPKHDLAIELHRKTERLPGLKQEKERLESRYPKRHIVGSGDHYWFEDGLAKVEYSTAELQRELEELSRKAKEFSEIEQQAFKELKERTTTFLQELVDLKIQRRIQSLTERLDYLESEEGVGAEVYRTKEGDTSLHHFSGIESSKNSTVEFQRELEEFRQNTRELSDKEKSSIEELQDRASTLLQKLEDLKIQSWSNALTKIEEEKDDVANGDIWSGSRQYLSSIEYAINDFLRDFGEFREKESELSDKAKSDIDELQKRATTFLHEFEVFKIEIEIKILEKRKKDHYSNPTSTQARSETWQKNRSEIDNKIKEFQKEIEALTEDESEIAE